jgi:DNA-binding transcriptional LysR family regulator
LGFPPVELRQLAYLIGIVRAGSFSGAASALHVAQPALSRQIALLERELGVLLLTRNSRGIVPTPAGEEFFARAIEILRNVEDSKRELKALFSIGASAVIKIGLPLTLSRLLTPELFDTSRAHFPEIRIQISEAWTGHIHRDLLDGKLDFGVISNRQLDRRMIYRQLIKESVHLMCAPDHPFSRRPQRIEDVGRTPLVLPPRAHGIRLVVDDAFQRCLIRPNIVLESEVWAVITDVVRKGIACTLLPPRELRRELNAGSLSSAPIKPVLRTGLCLARLPGAKSARSNDAIFAFLAQQLAKTLRASSSAQDSET